MKGVIIAILAVLLTVPFVLAPDVDLRNLAGSCHADGNAEISMLHYGGPININDISISSVFTDTGSLYQAEGMWIGLENPLYITGDPLRVFFNTTNSPFKNNGTYEIHFSFFQKQTDYSKTDVGIGMNCPGIPCISDSECDFDAECSRNVCTALRCKKGEYVDFHRCVSKCNDFNPCTIDIYENGSCRHERNEGSCCRTDADCSLGLACSIDKCVDSKCRHTPVVCNAATDRCVNSTCIEPRGCIYETDASCLANENEKREYLVVIGEPTVHKQPFLSGFFGAIINFFRNLF